MDFYITKDITMRAALSYSINLDGDAHQTVSIISGSPLTLWHSEAQQIYFYNYDFWTFSGPMNCASEVPKNRGVSEALKTF